MFPIWENEGVAGSAHLTHRRPSPTFRRSRAAMNLPNSITLTRIAAVPALIWLLSAHSPIHTPGAQEATASLVFVAAAITDGLDGYLARKRSQVTTIGMLLDPLADKLLISAAFIALVAYNPRIVPPWIAVLIIGREFLVSGLRSIAAAEGFTITASEIGKLKTVLQMVAVTAAILAHRWIYWNLFGFILGLRLIAYTAIYWMTVISIISAADYFIGFWRQIDHAAERARTRRPSVLNRNSPTAPAETPTHII